MDIKKMLEAQKKLDDRIIAKHGIDTSTPEYFDNLKVALMVELAELANELQFFKYWKQDKKNNNDRVLDELADCLHFSLSIINLLVDDYEEFMINLGNVKKWDLCRDFNSLYLNINNCLQNTYVIRPNSLFSIDVFSGILDLGKMSGFTIDEIEQAYYKKNKENHARQDKNY